MTATACAFCQDWYARLTAIPGFLELVVAVLWSVGVLVFICVNSLVLVWVERKLSAKIQLRRGPLTAGPEGIFQTMLDSVKLLGKELMTPQHSVRGLFLAAPMLALVPAIASFAVLPFAPWLIAADLEIGFLLILAMSALAFLSFLLGGWASFNKYAALGGIRAIAQNIAYEVPLLLSVMGVIILAGSLSTQSIVASQSPVWYALLQPLGFLIFFCAILGETNRAPFDIPEGDSELVAGYHTEYSGMRFSIFFLAEYTHIFVGCALGATLFLGGWQGPFLPGPWWLLLKTYALVAVMMWIRWTFPRLRSDQLIHFSWKVLVPLALLNLLVTAFGVTLLGQFA